MSEVLKYIPTEAMQADQQKRDEINLANPEFLEQALVEKLGSSVDQIGQVIIDQTGTSLTAETQAAQDALKNESHGGFLQSIRDSVFYQKMIRLTLGASIFLSIAMPSKAEAGEMPDTDMAGDVDEDAGKGSLEDLNRASLDAYKNLLDPDSYQGLEDSVKKTMDTEGTDEQKRQDIGQLFADMILEVDATAPDSPTSLEQDLREHHGGNEQIMDKYFSPDASEDEQLQALKDYGQSVVNQAKKKGATTIPKQSLIRSHTFEYSVDTSGDTTQCIITDTATHTSATFDI